MEKNSQNTHSLIRELEEDGLHNQPALENKSPPACIKHLHKLWGMHLGGNSLHMGIKPGKDICPSLIQFIPVSLIAHLADIWLEMTSSSHGAISQVGQEGTFPHGQQKQLPWGWGCIKGYLWAPSSGLKGLSNM